MSPRDWPARVEDILEAIENSQSYVRDMTYEEFVTDTKTVRASAYEVGVIGEATGRIPTEVRQLHPEVPWDKMQAMRNFVFHEYFRIDLDILWQTITQNLPPLLPLLRDLLDQEFR